MPEAIDPATIEASSTSISPPAARLPLQSTDRLPLPPLFANSTSSPTLLTQGAEALVYSTVFLHQAIPCALKYRPSKPYRHPILDARLTKARIASEARILVKCRSSGVSVPAVLALDEREGWLMMEWVEGRTVRDCLDEVLHRPGLLETKGGLEGKEEEVMVLMGGVGRAVAKMHDIGVVHGDLTTSNLMLRPPPLPSSETTSKSSLDGEIVIIDFGLGMQNVQDEDKAVDLYVLERAFGSTHPRAEGLFREVLRVYGESCKGGKVVLKRLEDVRQRGRKRSMIG